MKSAGSRLFCEAFFVLREGAGTVGEEDMLREANRILEENTLRAPRARAGVWLLLCAAFLFGAALSALGFFLFSL